MDSNIEKPKLVEVAERLERNGVAFIVIGGQAAALHGSPLATFDVDLCHQRSYDNLRRLAEVLRELRPTLRGAPPDLPFRLDAESLALGSNFTFDTNIGPLDLLGWVEPLGTYEDLLPGAESIEVGDLRLTVMGLDDLITVKRHLRRPKDQAALVQLEALRALRET